MTYEEAKHEVAKKYECLNWDELRVNIQLSAEFREEYKVTWASVDKEAALVYAKSKWDEGFNKSIAEFEYAKTRAKTMVELVQLDAVLTILDLTKKKFTP